MPSSPKIPSRNLVFQWEAERDELSRHIFDSQQRLAHLQARIDTAWATRTPVLDDDALRSVVDLFSPPSIFQHWPHLTTESTRSYPAVRRSHAKENRIRMTALAGLCLVAKRFVEPARKWLYHDLLADDPDLSRPSEQLARTLQESSSLGSLIRRIHLTPKAWQMWGHLSSMPNIETVWAQTGRDSEAHELLSLGKVQDMLLIEWDAFDASYWRDACAAWPHLSRLMFPSPKIPRSNTKRGPKIWQSLLFGSLNTRNSYFIKRIPIPCLHPTLHPTVYTHSRFTASEENQQGP